MQDRPKHVAAFIFGGLIVGAPFAIRIRKDWKAFKKDQEEQEMQKRVSWVAAGVVKERIRQGIYTRKFPDDFQAQVAASHEDFSFEMIRIRNEDPLP